MKKVLAFLVVLAISLLSLASCTNAETEDNTQIRIGYMQGPTGMGMAKLIHDNGGVSGNDKYQFVKYGDVKEATAALLAGNIDVACLPTNNAAALYTSQAGNVRVLALNCLNSLYVMTKSGTEIETISDLEGKTVYTIANGDRKSVV